MMPDGRCTIPLHKHRMTNRAKGHMDDIAIITNKTLCGSVSLRDVISLVKHMQRSARQGEAQGEIHP
jgi:hypothetical protein